MRCGLVDVPGWFSVVTLPCSQITHCFLVGAFGVVHRTCGQYTRAAPSKELKKKRWHPGALSLIRNPFHVLIGLRTMRNTVIA